ncbi:hypothetical protein [Micromonospora pisi]|nr:hypothetical protein [Micromonospora pisi]
MRRSEGDITASVEKVANREEVSVGELGGVQGLVVMTWVAISFSCLVLLLLSGFILPELPGGGGVLLPVVLTILLVIFGVSLWNIVVLKARFRAIDRQLAKGGGGPGRAAPKQRDFWIAVVAGVLMMALFQIAGSHS